MQILDFKLDPLRFFHPVLEVKNLRKKPIGVQVAQTKIVLFRDQTGTPIALEDKCPHRFTPLSLGNVLPNGRIACAYHGWNFGADGDCKNPSLENEKTNCRIRKFQVKESFGLLWIANPEVTQKDFPKVLDEDATLIQSYRIQFNAPFHVVFDNFSEDEHFPYVHTLFGWNSEQSKQVRFVCVKGDDSIEVCYWGPQRPFPGHRLLGFKKGSWIRNGWVTKFNPVHSVFTNWICDKNTLEKAEGDAKGQVAIFMTPVGNDKTDMFVVHGVKFLRKFNFFESTLFRYFAGHNAKKDILNDVSFTATLGDVETDLKESVLGRFDRALVYNRELFNKIYLGHGEKGASKPEAVPPHFKGDFINV